MDIAYLCIRKQKNNKLKRKEYEEFRIYRIRRE
nr:MAG TPA: hypothetical protein [Bacteriophage sp.]